MRLRKEILLFYGLIIVSAGVIIAADQPNRTPAGQKPCVKCCKINKQGEKKQSAAPPYYLTEGIFRLKA